MALAGITLVVPAAVGIALVQALSGYLTRKRVAEVHVLVNARLTDALNEIRSLKQELAGHAPSPPGG